MLESFPAERVAVFAPHMDDETIGCGGTLVKWASAGSEIAVIFMTDGRKGDHDLAALAPAARTVREKELVGIRKKEAERAAEILGVKSLIFLDAEDSNLRSTESIRGKVREVLARIRPDVVFLPFLLEEHADHRATAEVVLDATTGGYRSFTCFSYEVWTPLFVNVLVDISDVVKTKERALLAYESQMKDKNLVRSSLGLNAYRSIVVDRNGDGFLEGFFESSLEDLWELRAGLRS